jgi:putative methionine-R-sulfoxide reductase with GAF domain
MAKLIRSRLKFYNVEVMSLDPDGKEFQLVAIDGGFKKKARKTVPIDQCIVGWCLSEDKNIFVNDVTVDPRCSIRKYMQTKSEMVVLIRSGDDVVGAVIVKSKHFDAFNEWDLQALEAVVRQMENVLWHLKKK